MVKRVHALRASPSEATTSLSADTIQDHSRQVHAFGYHGDEARRRTAYVRVPRQTDGRKWSNQSTGERSVSAK